MDSNSTITMPDNVKKETQEDLFAALGASDIPDEDKGALLAKMMDLVQSRSIVVIYDQLSEEKKKEMEELADKDDPDILEEFLNKNIPEYEQVFIDEAKKLRQELTIEFAE